MLDYEKALRTIIAKRKEKGFVLDKDLDVPEETLEVLESKGLIICANQGGYDFQNQADREGI